MENILWKILPEENTERFLTATPVFSTKKKNRPINQQEALLDKEFHRVALALVG